MLHSPSLSRQHLDQLLTELPEKSALSTMLIYKKLLNIVSTSEGYHMRLDFRIRAKPPGPRVYKSKIGIYCIGKRPKNTWYKVSKDQFMNVVASANQLVDEWTKFKNYIDRYTPDGSIMCSLLHGFEVISDTIRECDTCTRILVPMDNQLINWDAAEYFALN